MHVFWHNKLIIKIVCVFLYVLAWLNLTFCRETWNTHNLFISSGAAYHIRPTAVPYYITLHYVTLRYVTLRYVTSRHVTSRHVTSRHVTSRHVTSRHITSHHITSHHITSHYITLHYITLHYIILSLFTRHLHLKWPLVLQQSYVYDS